MGEVYERRLNVCMCVYVHTEKTECVRVPLQSRRVNVKELPVHLNNGIVSFKHHGTYQRLGNEICTVLFFC